MPRRISNVNQSSRHPSSPMYRLLPIFLYTASTLIGEVSSIGCFMCSSFNGSNPDCEDPFNSTSNSSFRTGDYHSPCWAKKKNRDGSFPADHCIKINGDSLHSKVVIRTCALDSGSLTADTEIVRISHCGNFKLGGVDYSGCVQACDSDGCNPAAMYTTSIPILIVLLFFLALRQR